MVKVLVSVIVILNILLIAAIGVIVALLKDKGNSKEQLKWYNMSSR